MKYLTSEEKARNKEIKEYFSGYVSKTLRSGVPVQLIEKYVPNRDAMIIDAGCSNGFFLSQLWDVGYKNLAGMDFDNYLSEEAKKKVKNFYQVDFSVAMPDLKEIADCVTAWCVIPHLENPYNFIRGISKLLKFGGLFIFSMPNIESHSHRRHYLKTGEMINYSHKNDHITIMTPNIINKTFSKDFDSVAVEYFVKDKIFRGLKGKIKRWIINNFPNSKARYASKKIYVFRKKSGI